MKVLTIASLISFFTIGLSISLIALFSPENTFVVGANTIFDPIERPDSGNVEAITVAPIIRSEVVIEDFSIQIPKISLNKRIVANVDPINTAEYLAVIEKDIAHGKYTLLPFQAKNDGNVYLFAHREGSSGFFNRLGELQKGDEILITFNNELYVYSVEEMFVVNPEDTFVYTADSAYPALTLQTCENGNTQRLIIKSKLISVI